MSAPTISVVIPAYNAAKHLERCLASVYRQTYPLHEIIVVNDGSTDHTLEVLKSHADRIRLFSTPNGGASAARNYGIQQVTGDWVAFLDADDEWCDDKTARQMAILTSYPETHVLYAQMQDITSDGKAIFTWPPVVNEGDPSPKMIKEWACLINYPPTPMILVRTEALRKVGPFDLTFKNGEDTEMWVRLLSLGPFRGVNAVLGNRYLRSESLSAQLSSFRSMQLHVRIHRQHGQLIQRLLDKHGVAVNFHAFSHNMTALEALHEKQFAWARYHAFMALCNRNEHYIVSMKLLLEATLGPAWYNYFVSLVKSKPQGPQGQMTNEGNDQ